MTYNINPLATGDVYARCYFNFGSQNWYGNDPGTVQVLYLNYGNYNAQICLHGGNVSSNVFMQESKTWTGVSGNTVFAANTWYCVQIHVAPPSTSTLIELWVNGTKMGSTTADFSSATGCKSVQIGDLSGGSTAVSFYMDQLIVNNAYILP